MLARIVKRFNNKGNCTNTEVKAILDGCGLSDTCIPYAKLRCAVYRLEEVFNIRFKLLIRNIHLIKVLFIACNFPLIEQIFKLKSEFTISIAFRIFREINWAITYPVHHSNTLLTYFVLLSLNVTVLEMVLTIREYSPLVMLIVPSSSLYEAL